MMRLATLLRPELVKPNLSCTSKMNAVGELLDMIIAVDNSIDRERVWDKIVEREQMEDTSYGRGFAFPHARTDAVTKMYLAMGVAPKGLESCRDGSTLKVVCLLLTPVNISKLYLQTLSAFAAFARTPGNLESLQSARSAEQVIDIIWASGAMVNKNLIVSDLMRHDPPVAHETDSLRDAANLLFRFKLSGLPVVDDAGKLLGHVTDRDLLAAALPEFKNLISAPDAELPEEPFEALLSRADQIDIAQLYQEDHEIVSPEDSIVRASARMIALDLRRLYVVDDSGKLVGVLHRKDIVNMILRG